MRLRAALVGCLLLTLACGGGGGGGGPTEPPPASLTGTWNGAFTATSGGTGSTAVRLQLVHVGNGFTGTWTAETNSGTLGGLVNGAGIVFDMATGAGPCDFTVTGTWTGTAITGTWARRNCTPPLAGTAAFSKAS